MKSSEVKLTFLGGADTVTGSKILVEYHETRVLVDCGLFQGLKELRVQNRQPLSVNPESIDAVLLTHAHLDHTGYLPVLVKNGYSGPIHCTHPTVDITRIILDDSAKIQEEEAEDANRNGYSSHDKATPLYDREDAAKVYPMLVGHDNSEWVIIHGDLKFQFHHSGHILGSAIIEMNAGDKKIIFSGDLGRQKPLLLYPPKHLKEADVIIMESTYGNRLHPEANAMETLEKMVNHTKNKGGILVVPTFAVERAQEIIYLLALLKEQERIPNWPVYLDSPMAVNTTKVFFDYSDWHILNNDDIRVIQDEVKLISDYYQSQEIVNNSDSKIVLAGSGMVTGGRVLYYLQKLLSDKKNTILLPGFQAIGTRGRSLVDGESDIKFFGQWHPVKAEVFQMESLSAHADQNDIIDWISKFSSRPKKIFLNHGEAQASNTLRLKLKDTFDLDVEVAHMHQSYHV